MPDWTKPMSQTFKYYVVDPGTWKDKTRLKTIKTCTIERDSSADTLGSASIELTDNNNEFSNIVGRNRECYVRVYLVTGQNGISEKFPLGTFLIQSTSTSFDGMVKTTPIEAYTPLLEMKDVPPPIGYSILKGANIMTNAYHIVREQTRAPVVEPTCSETLYSDFVAEESDTWLSYTKDLVANAKYELGLDELSRILFLPVQDTASLQPVTTFDDDNSSILYPEISTSHDLYGIPNVVEVVYSKNNENFSARVVNDDPNSPISVQNRGREIVYRETNTDFAGTPTNLQIQKYAEGLLKSKSSVEFTVSYSHGYCPVRVGDCVRLNYERAGIVNVKAKVISQSISCTPGCKVTEKAVYTERFWG